VNVCAVSTAIADTDASGALTAAASMVVSVTVLGVVLHAATTTPAPSTASKHRAFMIPRTDLTGETRRRGESVMQPYAFVLACSAVGVVACGGGHSDAPITDAPVDVPIVDAPINALLDATIPDCDYTEAADATNATTAEATQVVIGATTRDLCGQIDPGHFDVTSHSADIDSFNVTVNDATAELIVRFENQAPGMLTDFQIQIFSAATPPMLISVGDYTGALADHGAFLAELPIGSYNIMVTASAPSATPAAIPYKIRLAVDHPTTRCPDLTGMAANYTEQSDGAANTGNDVVLVDFTNDPSFTLTPATTDAPEMTGLTITTNQNAHIVGSSGTAAASPDDYVDRDSYTIATGPTTNELSVRLDWPGATADLDYIVFPSSSIAVPNQVSSLTATTQGEFATFAVEPNASYLLWVGAYTGSTGMPIAYSATVCGGSFTP
jgi:hypothetical protein